MQTDSNKTVPTAFWEDVRSFIRDDFEKNNTRLFSLKDLKDFGKHVCSFRFPEDNINNYIDSILSSPSYQKITVETNGDTPLLGADGLVKVISIK